MTANYLKCSGPKTVTGKKVFQTGKVLSGIISCVSTVFGIDIYLILFHFIYTNSIALILLYEYVYMILFLLPAEYFFHNSRQF